MRSPIPEALLEMHYFHVVRDHFAALLGRNDFHIFKPSTRIENWYGFDQSYFSSEGTTEYISGSIRRYIHEQYGSMSFTLRAYFLQFKVVQKLLRRSSATPPGWDAPYYRSELSLDPKKETGISQHETILRASSIGGAVASYVCPMIFTEDDVKRDAYFSDLRFVDVTTAPFGWATNQKHYICFQELNQSPFWCSEPTEGKLIEFDQLFRGAETYTPESFDRYIQTLLEALQTKEQIRLEANPLPSSMIVIATPKTD